MKHDKNISRRGFLKFMGAGAALSVVGCNGRGSADSVASDAVDPGDMTYRMTPCVCRQ